MRSRLKLLALLVTCHLVCLESLAGIASAMNALDSHCRPGACFCARMMRARQKRAHSASDSRPERRNVERAPPCSSHPSHETPPPSLRITVPVPPFDPAPGLTETACLLRPRSRIGSGYFEVETPPPR
jgi:hypothetical protein